MKEYLRKKGLALRKQMHQDEVNDLSKKIIKQIKKQIDLMPYQVFGFYMPLGNEVDLRPLMRELIDLRKTIVIPKVHDQYTMDFYPIETINDVHKGHFGVLEPNCNRKMPKNKIDIIFIPGIYFSFQNYRLGFGAGYYDRYLKDYYQEKVGICYSFQHINNIPSQDYDIPMDFIITENPSHQPHN
ncbi:5-formyltetrahydrofolate cyclo-ligase [Mycoplasmatota bacterium]|nr:5-formyltetrahydrofolate cyclo-ligase [Mycoplasmatota bacterium]